MKQYLVINKIVEELINNNYIGACYIGGSIGRKEEDNLSDIDLYCYFFTENFEDFTKNKLNVFEKYGVMIFHRDYNDLDTVVYTDGIILNLYSVYPSNDGLIKVDKNVKVIYNPYNIVLQEMTNSYKFSNREIGGVIDKLSLDCLEFYRYFIRNDFPIILRIASDIHCGYSCIKHFVSDPEYAKLGAKNILKEMEKEERAKYIEIIKNYSFSNLKQFVKMIVNDVAKILGDFPVTLATSFNIDFFEFVKKKIMEL